jgi:tetratricopeptide (TPR) repeat protein
LAFLQEDKGELAVAEATRWEALAMLRELHCTNCSDIVEGLHDLAELVAKRGDRQRAEGLHREAITISVTDRSQYVTIPLENMAYRGKLYAKYGLWTDAAEDMAKVVQLEPAEHLNYYLLAPLLVKMGRTAQYRTQSDAMLAWFRATTNPVVAERTARTSLLLAENCNAAEANRLADVAVIQAGLGHPDLAYFEFVKALAEYRLGHFEEAVKWSKQSLARRTPWAAAFNSSREVVAYVVEAMAEQKLGRTNEASASLDKGVEIMNRDAPKRAGKSDGTLLVDWMTCEILLQEAKAGTRKTETLP